jgi:hypothetical protein
VLNQLQVEPSPAVDVSLHDSWPSAWFRLVEAAEESGFDGGPAGSHRNCIGSGGWLDTSLAGQRLLFASLLSRVL